MNNISDKLTKYWRHFLGTACTVGNEYKEFDYLCSLINGSHLKASHLPLDKVDIEERPESIRNFTSGKMVSSRIDRSIEREEKIIDVRHFPIQQKLCQQLQQEFGDRVKWEWSFKGNRIDVVLINDNQTLSFYEIKTAGTAKACIREALGQLMEYGYWSGCSNVAELVVVGECPSNTETEKYLQYLRERFNIPLRYQMVSLMD